MVSINPAQKEQVLIVDDEPQVLVALEDLLSDDYVVVKCSSGESALRVAEETPNLSVVLSDQRMPRMSGDRLLSELQRVCDASRVLVTGFADLGAVVRAVNEGKIFAYVSKPWDPGALKLTIDKAAEHCRLQRELVRERVLLIDLMDSISDGIFVKDRDLRFQRVNRAFVDVLLDRPIGPGGVVGRRLSELWQDEEAHQNEAAERTVLESELPAEDILERVRRDPGYRWYSKSLAPLRGPDGRVEGVVGVVRDVTERAQMADALKAGEERQRLVIEAAGAGLFDWDQVTGNVHYSEEFAALLGEEVATLAPSFAEFSARLHPEDAKATLDLVRPVTDDPVLVKALECRLRGRDGTYRWFQLNAKVLLGEAGRSTRLVGAIQDISERKEQQEGIANLLRVRAVLGEVNGTIARVRDREALLQRASEILVRVGGVPLAMVCATDAAGLWRPVASDGADPGLLELVRSNEERGALGLSKAHTQALEGGQPVLLNGAELASGGHLGVEIQALGYKSLAVFPLQVAGKLQYALVLVTAQLGFFDTEEVALLQELAANVAFGLEHEAKSQRLSLLLSHDELTELSRRELFVDRLQQRLSARDPGQAYLAVLWVDISRFRHVNETLGRTGGDALLRQFARRLRVVVEDDDLLARVDANAFAVISPPLAHEAAVTDFLSRLRRGVLDTPFEVEGTELRLSATIGVAMFPNDGQEADSLLFHAETAGKTARTSGQPYLFYAPSMHERVAEKLAMETRLRRAIEREEFVLHYQPKVSLETGEVTGLEALVRWRDPEVGLVQPGTFIPLLEETGLILEVGRWVLLETIRQQRRWREAGRVPPRVAVNVSAVQLAHGDFLQSLRSLLDADPDQVPRIDLEITESMVMGDFTANVEKLRLARAAGVGVALDDFGTGYSSLGYLRRLPADVIKVDRSFVSKMDQSAADMAIVSTVITLAHSLGLRVVAEGVETTNQAHLLRLLRCDEIQGYLIAKPLPAEEVEALFAERYSFENVGSIG